MSVSEGETIDSLLGGDCEKPIFLVNPLFLEFCLWLLYSSDDTFFFNKEGKEKVCKILVSYLKEKIDNERLDFDHLCKDFWALASYSYYRRAVTKRDRMVVDLVKDVLSKCSKIEYLALPIWWPVDELLAVVNPNLWYSQIHTLCLGASSRTERPEQPEREISICMFHPQNLMEVLPVVLKYCYRAERRPLIDLFLDSNPSIELSEFIQIEGIHQLQVCCLIDGRVSCNQDIPPCPSLRQLHVLNLKNGDHVLSTLRKAFQRGHLPNSNDLGFPGCSFSTEGILPYVFKTQTSVLEHLSLMKLKLNRSDLQFISELRTLRSLSLSVGSMLCEADSVKFLFPSGTWGTLSDFYVTNVDLTFCEEFVPAVNKNQLPNLEKLHLSCDDQLYEKTDSDIEDISLLQIQAEKLPYLKSLFLAGFINSEQEVQDLAQKVVKWDLGDLDIHDCKGVSGHLSVLFRHCFPSLEHLSLAECELNSDDMCCLTEARKQGKLPKLKTLNVLNNRIENAKMWNEKGAWKSVETNMYLQRKPPRYNVSETEAV